jgi:hypothetical protein
MITNFEFLLLWRKTLAAYFATIYEKLSKWKEESKENVCQYRHNWTRETLSTEYNTHIACVKITAKIQTLKL